MRCKEWLVLTTNGSQMIRADQLVHTPTGSTFVDHRRQPIATFKHGTYIAIIRLDALREIAAIA